MFFFVYVENVDGYTIGIMYCSTKIGSYKEKHDLVISNPDEINFANRLPLFF